MYNYPADAPAIDILGALSAPAHDGIVRPRRLPEKYRDQIPTTFMRVMVDAAAGVRIRFATTATSITLRLRAFPIVFTGPSPDRISFVDLTVDGHLVTSRPVQGARALLDIDTDSVDMETALEESIEFPNLEARMKTIELWLPHTAIVDLVGLAADRPIIRAPKAAKKVWVHHGSSISHCFEAATPTRTWPAVAAALLGYDVTNLGYAGNAMLDPFIARAIRDEPADLITFKLGINLINGDIMRMRALTPAVHGYIDTVREQHATVPLVVISPILCPIVESRPGPTESDELGRFRTTSPEPFPSDVLTLERTRTALAKLVENRRANDANLFYLDGRSLFGTADVAAGHLPDNLHPDDDGYHLMGERFAQLLPKMVSLAN